nr:peptidoglycan DD-metalloendopeptidase family protein [uncultured Sphingomonas sp.]
MRALPFLVAATLPLVAAAAPVLPRGPSADQQLVDARRDAANSARELGRLEAAVQNANDEVARRKAEQAVAAAAITDAEARIGEADAEARLADARAAYGKARLDRERAPIAGLIGGLVAIGREPPLLALFDGTSPEELVRLKALVDVIDPIIRQRTAQLAAQYEAQQRLAATAQTARRRLAENRTLLTQRQVKFAALEAAAAGRAASLTNQSVSAGDRVLADQEMLQGAEAAARSQGSALVQARTLAALGLSPPRPVAGDAALPTSDFAYMIPVDAPVIDGVGSISRAGIVARGTRFNAQRGAPLVAPASGTIRFAGPFRSTGGVIIIDHGKGRTSLLLGVASTLKKGEKVAIGQKIGIATGDVDVEFRDNGRILSPAFIAASSPPLSNAVRTR